MALVYPHRRMMIWGVVLGAGVALTYAASIGGLLPVMKVITSNEGSLHDALASGALKAGGPTGGEQWFSPYFRSLAPLFPAGNAPADRMKTLLILISILLSVNILGNVFRCASQYLILNASNRMMMDLRRKMYRKALRVPMVDLSGEVSNRVNQFLSDTREIFLGVTTLFGKVAREPLKAICVLAVALFLDSRLTLIALAITPVAVAILWYFGRKVRKATVRLLEGYGVMLNALEETLQGIEVVKGYGREGYERRRMWRIERRMLKQLLRLAWIEAVSSPA